LNKTEKNINPQPIVLIDINKFSKNIKVTVFNNVVEIKLGDKT